MSRGVIGYAQPNAENPTEKWSWRAISPRVTTTNKEGKEAPVFQRFTHGLGVGDVNNDGRLDIMEARGWWEQPATSTAETLWTFHEAIFGKGGA